MGTEYPRLRDRYCSASGGLLWHWRALRARHTLWRPFRKNLAQWLDAWHPASSRLLLVGPSAGWTLPESLLTRFEEVVVLEPDPLARFLLKHRFPGAKLVFSRLDLFAPGGLEALRRLFPAHALLFCNVLGQLSPESGAQAWCETLRRSLADDCWASWHDLASSERPPDRCDRLCWPAGSSFEEVLAGAWSGGEIAVRDHGTLALAGPGAFETASWSLHSGQHHLIAWVVHRKTGAGRELAYPERV